MSDTTQPLSVRLPKDLRARLDQVTETTQRSRASIIIDALERQLDLIERGGGVKPTGRFQAIYAAAGEGLRTGGSRSAREIDEEIAWLRGRD